MNHWLNPEYTDQTRANSQLVVVIGDVMLDRYWFGDSKRISPEAPVPVVNITQKEDRLGGAANVALNLQAIEISVNLLGITGQDDHADVLNDLCAQANIQAQLITESARPTICKLRVISRHQHMMRLDFEESDAHQLTTLSALQNAAFKAIDQAALVLFSDYNKGTLAQISTLIDYAKRQNKPILVDPKGHSFEKYRGATLITPNRAEFESVVGICHTEAELLQKGENLRQSLDLQAILITRSEQGMTLIEKGKDAVTFPAKARDVFDVTGAGDTVVALLAAAIAQGESLADAARIANIGASIVVGKLGASCASKMEIWRIIEAENALLPQQASQVTQISHPLVLTKEALKIQMDHAKAAGETIVMTNGCFDLLHLGHVTYLEQARKLGQRLIVALNSDASVKRLKGVTRPVMGEVSRACVLASLSFVDWVVIFEEDTPQGLIEYLLPDILVKGGDYRVETVAGAQAVLENGGQVQILNLVEGYSTSAAIHKIQN